MFDWKIKNSKRLLVDHSEEGKKVFYKNIYNNVDGIVKAYYPSGALKAIYSCNNGMKEGPVTMYRENGSVKVKGFFHNDQFEGWWEFYDEDQVRFVFYHEGEVSSFPFVGVKADQEEETDHQTTIIPFPKKVRRITIKDILEAIKYQFESMIAEIKGSVSVHLGRI